MLVWAGEREVGGVAEGLLSLLAGLMERGRSPSFRVPGARPSLNVLSLPGPLGTSWNGMCNLVTTLFSSPVVN